MRAWEARALPLGDTRARPNASTTPAINARNHPIHSKRKARSRRMAPCRLSGGQRRCRPTSRPLTDGADAAQQARDFRWAAPTLLNSPAIPSGRRRHCRWPLRPQHPRRQRLVPCCRLAEQRLASLESNGAQCILQCLTMAIKLRHVFSRRPLTEITPLSGNTSPPCIQNEVVLARFVRRVSK